jgi:hypothetical protein
MRPTLLTLWLTLSGMAPRKAAPAGAPPSAAPW